LAPRSSSGCLSKVRLNFACLASSGSLQGEARDDQIILAAGRTKNKREHVVPLSDAAKTILSQFRRDGMFGRRDSGFLDWSKAKTFDSGAAEVGKWTLHDLAGQPSPAWRPSSEYIRT